jgi:predicted Zn finger-like uncharacterized protein
MLKVYWKDIAHREMIIPCKSCHSIFQLDSRLLKPTGSKVGCTKCGEIFKAYPPQANRRRYKRVKTCNLISFLSFDKTGKLISNGLGVALDVSQRGLIVLATTDRENHLFKVKGKLLHSTKASNGLYHSGIKFIDIDWKVKAFIKKLIKEYNYQGYNLFIAIAKKSNKPKLSSLPNKIKSV